MSVDSETHDQEWTMIGVVGCRSHNSGVIFFFSCGSKVRCIFMKCPCMCHEGI